MNNSSLNSTAAIQVPNFEAMLDPYPEYASLAAAGPVRVLKSHVGVEYYGIFDSDLARQALRDQRISKSAVAMHKALDRQGLEAASAGFPISAVKGSNLLNTDPPEHTRLRQLVNLSFSPRRIELLRAQVERLVVEVIDNLRGKDQVDLVSEFTYPIGLTMICNVLGVPPADRGQFRHLATQSMTPGASNQADCRAKLLQYLADLVAAKRESIDPEVAPDEQPDVLSAMCASRLASDVLTDEELVSMSFLLLIAGHETTVGLIGNAVILLDRHIEQRQKLIADRGLLPQMVEEVARFDGPVHQTTMRATLEDVDLGGSVIPAGNFVRVFLAHCNRDPKVYKDPNQFDITRKPMPNLAFGHGPHFCLGSFLAKLEAQVAIGSFLDAFPEYRLVGGTDAIEWAGTVVRAAARISASLSGRIP
ncbi:cytochrome P450 [Acidovorax sp. ACV02]|uniref:cytochrome P450 n=1 Tax=Acidovorax sp. ACV02 TaxID=2769310 RepID=UPI00177DBEB4|nr:cytochrome P450 [Acidovorax sp. ACV02]MBD9408388.1 cytochrome P450 [Acidovorax sp. ACV02]